MEDVQTATLTPQVLGALLSAAGLEPSAHSPVRGLAGDASASVEASRIDLEPLRPALTDLAQPSRFVRVMIPVADRVRTSTFYAADGGRTLTKLDEVDGAYLISSPWDPEAISAASCMPFMAAEAPVRPAPLTVTLPVAGLYTLVAVIDTVRAKLMSSMLDRTAAVSYAFTEEDLLSQARWALEFADARWLTRMVVEVAATGARVRDQLESIVLHGFRVLVERGLVTVADDRWGPGELVRSLAADLLNPLPSAAVDAFTVRDRLTDRFYVHVIRGGRMLYALDFDFGTADPTVTLRSMDVGEVGELVSRSILGAPVATGGSV